MILSDGRCFLCALGQCKRCTNPRCTHDHVPNRRWDGDPRTDPQEGRHDRRPR